MPILGCVRPSLGRPVADVIDKKDQFLCRICLNGNAVKPCRPRSAAAPSCEAARQILFFTMSKMSADPEGSEICHGSHNLCPPDPHPVRDRMVEPDGIEPTTSCLQSRRSPN